MFGSPASNFVKNPKLLCYVRNNSFIAITTEILRFVLFVCGGYMNISEKCAVSNLYNKRTEI